jgi:nucleotide-binding universal stress UspA family protein
MLNPAKTILVAIDPTVASQSALQQALRLAASMQARLVVVSVTPQYEGNMHRWKIADANEQFSLPFKQCLQEAETTAAILGQPIRTVHRIGVPSEEIVAVAEEESAGLLLMGSPHRSYVEQVLLGRTVAKVIGLSPCDVMLIPHGAEVNFSRILVGIDGSKYSMGAGQQALDLALAYGGEVHALMVLDIPINRSLLYKVLDEARRKSFTYLQTVADQGEKLGVPVIAAVREGSPYEGIVQYGEEKNMQLIVLGSFGRTALTRILMGSVVERVATLSPLPVMVVKKLGEDGVRDLA